MDYTQIVKALDSRNVEVIIEFTKNNTDISKKDIILELCREGLLTHKRLNFIINKCMNYLYISDNLIKFLMQKEQH